MKNEIKEINNLINSTYKVWLYWRVRRVSNGSDYVCEMLDRASRLHHALMVEKVRIEAEGK